MRQTRQIGQETPTSVHARQGGNKVGMCWILRSQGCAVGGLKVSEIEAGRHGGAEQGETAP
jgi:hypothetical protein